jgi:hypothetical protein
MKLLLLQLLLLQLLELLTLQELLLLLQRAEAVRRLVLGQAGSAGPYGCKDNQKYTNE